MTGRSDANMRHVLTFVLRSISPFQVLQSAHISHGKANLMAVVLCTGSDPVLMKTRQMILESAGHKVLSAISGGEVEILCSEFTFHVAVLGQSAAPNLKRETLAAVRRSCPTAKVLELYPVHLGKVLKDADAWLEMPPESPDMLIKMVDGLATSAPGRGV